MNEVKRCRQKRTASALPGISLVNEVKHCRPKRTASTFRRHFPREGGEALSHVADSIGIMTGISLAKEVKRGHTDRIG